MEKKEDSLLTVPKIAKLLNISRSKAYSLIKDPTFPTIRIGKCIRIRKSDLENWLYNSKKAI